MATLPLRRPQTGLWRGSTPAAATHGRRLSAVAIDLTLLVLPTLLAGQVLPLIGPLLVPWLYFSIFEASAWQATPGKRLLGLRVVDVNGVPLRWARATLRYFCRFVSALPLGAGYAMVLFTLNRQALHDMLASTRVVMR